MILYKMTNKNTGESKYYSKQKTMCEEHGFKGNMVRAVIRGKRKSHHGYRFNRLEVDSYDGYAIEDLKTWLENTDEAIKSQWENNPIYGKKLDMNRFKIMSNNRKLLNSFGFLPNSNIIIHEAKTSGISCDFEGLECINFLFEENGILKISYNEMFYDKESDKMINLEYEIEHNGYEPKPNSQYTKGKFIKTEDGGYHSVNEKKFKKVLPKKDVQQEEIEKYKVATEITKDGSYKSDKLLKMSEEESKDVEFLLKAHGFDPKVWELLNARNNIWNVYSKIDGVQQLYSSKITVKPKTEEFNLDWYKDVFREIEEINPYEHLEGMVIKKIEYNENKVVELQFADLHIGLNGIPYEDKLKQMAKNIIDKHNNASEFILPIGQDWLNSDIQIGADFKTTKGTSLQQSLSYEEMIKTGIRVATFIVDYILKTTSANIDCIYIPANHDRHSTYGLFQAIKQRYFHFSHDAFITKRIYFDDKMTPRKYRRIGVNGLMLAHGDKERKNIFKCFQVEAPTIFAKTKFREAHLSHLHSESVISDFGITFRRLPTVNTPDDWHTESGYVGATNRIQAFVYDIKHGLSAIEYYYID